MKKYANLSIIYAVIAMVLGVFYREFTKLRAFTGDTRLSVMHTHYLVLGMVFFLMLLVLDKNFGFSAAKESRTVILLYNIGLNITGISLFTRGMTQVLGTPLSPGLDASISGISGIGHIILGISIIMLLRLVRRSVVTSYS